jgi:hypothetical protein
VTWTAVPKAPIHKDRDAQSWEDKIGIPEQPKLSPPARKARLTQQLKEDLLGAGVTAREHPAHDLRPLATRESVGHSYPSLIISEWSVSTACNLSL